MKIEQLKDKKILILGLGREGMDNLNFLRKFFPEKIFGIADKDESVKFKVKDEKIEWHLGENHLKAIKNYDVIFKSPGVPPKIIEPFLDKEKIVTCQTEIFLQNCPGKIVGITGTKGKSTAAALIHEVLKEGELKSHLIGNIGRPVLNFLFSATKKDIFVYELSCHQLFNLKISPQVAVILNIYPEHLDYYKDFKEYKMAKANITLYQKENDFLIFNAKDKNVVEIAKKSKAKKIPLKNFSKILKSVGLKKIPFWGNFYSLNIAAAIKVGEIFGNKKEKIKRAIENFKPLPHRLEFVGKFKGIYFFNDSLSTIPEATISALKSLGNKVQTLILGGYDRGLNFEKLAKEIIKRKIKNLIFFPTTGERIWVEILKKTKGKKLPNAFFVKNMKDAITFSFQNTQKGKICLLSPASPSFSIFKDYKERGNLFKKFVKEYGKK